MTFVVFGIEEILKIPEVSSRESRNRLDDLKRKLQKRLASFLGLYKSIEPLSDEELSRADNGELGEDLRYPLTGVGGSFLNTFA